MQIASGRKNSQQAKVTAEDRRNQKRETEALKREVDDLKSRLQRGKDEI